MKKFSKSTLFALIFISALFIGSCSSESPVAPSDTGTKIPNSPIPEDNAVDQLPALTLSWQAANAVKYDVYVDINNPPTNLFASGLDTNIVSVSGLDYQRTYYWKVIARASNGNVVSGPVWKFTTISRSSSQAGYLFIKHNFETRKPNIVSALFQVVGLDGRGVKDLDSAKFNALEDGEPIPVKESELTVRRRDEVPHTLQTVLMLDNSTSLKVEIDTIKNAAIDLVNNLLPGQEIAIYTFSDHAELIQDFSSNVNQLKAAISSIQIGFPTTNLYGAVVTGASKVINSFSFDNIIEGVLIIFTDGKDTQGSYSFSDAMSAVQEKRVYTVGLGSDIDPDVLNQIGTSGFFSINQAGDLSAKLLDIQNELLDFASSFYVLDYQSPKRGDFNHTLQIVIKDNVFTGQGSTAIYEFNSKDFYSVKPGLYINSDKNNPTGISSLTLKSGGISTVQANSLLVENTPIFVWQSSAPSVVSVQVDQNDDSRATIKALGSAGQSATVTVFDTQNTLKKDLTVNIK